MPVPNEGTTQLPSDASGRFHEGVWDGSNYYAQRGDVTYGRDVDVKRLPTGAAAAANVNLPAAATAAVITYGVGGAGVMHVFDYVAWSYSGNPTGGNLKIEDGAGITVFSVDITTAGPGFIPAFFRGTANTACIITLASGGGSIVGKVNAIGKRTET